MLNKNIRNIMVSVAGVAVATSAMAEGNSSAKAEVYGEFRSELTRNDDGLATLNEGGKSSAMTVLGLSDVKFGFKGKFNEKTSFNLRFDTTSTDSLVDVANATWKASEMVGVTIGRDYVRQGGYSNWDNSFSNVWGDRIQALAFGRNETSLSFHYSPNSTHNVTVQLVNDVMDDAATTDVKEAQYNTSHKQPAALLEYTGEFGSIKPMIQYGQYDSNHSSFFNVGARAKFGATAVTFDYGSHSAFQKVGTSDKAAVANNMTLRAEHEVGSMVPFVWFNSFNVVDKDVNGGTENKTNTTGDWDDNATQISVGSSFKNFGDNWTPYVAYRMTSGKFMPATTEKTGSEGELGLGVTGNF